MDRHKIKADKIRGFLDENPHIFEQFEREALRMVERGFKHYSAYTITEFLRHNSALRADPDYIYKVNNNIIPTLSRDFMDAHPEVPENFFEQRTASVVKKDKPEFHFESDGGQGKLI
jgi:hypothetical protein